MPSPEIPDARCHTRASGICREDTLALPPGKSLPGRSRAAGIHLNSGLRSRLKRRATAGINLDPGLPLPAPESRQIPGSVAVSGWPDRPPCGLSYPRAIRSSVIPTRRDGARRRAPSALSSQNCQNWAGPPGRPRLFLLVEPRLMRAPTRASDRTVVDRYTACSAVYPGCSRVVYTRGGGREAYPGGVPGRGEGRARAIGPGPARAPREAGVQVNPGRMLFAR